MIHIFSEKKQEQIGTGLLVLVVIMAIYFLSASFNQWKTARSTPNSAYPGLSITVDGEGKAFSVPDTGVFTYGVTARAATVGEAQQKVTQTSNSLMDALKAGGVEERHIKTIAYNVSPRYEWQQATGVSVGKNVLVGYEVSQSNEVKVKDATKAGELLGKIGSLGATDVSGLTFTQEDENAAKDEARKNAIDDSRRKAEILARQLGVTITRVAGFTEYGQDGQPVPYYGMDEMAKVSDASVRIATPVVALGENEIVSKVSVTYEIR